MIITVVIIIRIDIQYIGTEASLPFKNTMKVLLPKNEYTTKTN